MFKGISEILCAISGFKHRLGCMNAPQCKQGLDALPCHLLASEETVAQAAGMQQVTHNCTDRQQVSQPPVNWSWGWCARPQSSLSNEA